MSAVRTVCSMLVGSMLMARSVQAVWVSVLSDDFSSNTWSYAGVSNGVGQALLRYDSVQQRMVGEWRQGNYYSGAADPNAIVDSRVSRPLNRTLTDRDTFRFGATLRIDPGSVPDTLEFYEMANFGVYNLSADVIGADRLQSDNYSGNTYLVRDANDLVEFNYFINNRSFGFNPFVQGLAIARMPTNETDSTAYFVTGTGSDPFFHDTDMGADHYLPTASNLYVEVVYYGRATNAYARRVYTAIYTDAARTNLLVVNGVPMYYWTRAIPTDQAFDVNEAGIFNYAGVNFTDLFGGSTPDGAGDGSLDDLYVDLHRESGEVFSTEPSGSTGFVLTWASEPGTNYCVRATANILTGPWTTTCVLQATGPLTSVTNTLTGTMGIYDIAH